MRVFICSLLLLLVFACKKEDISNLSLPPVTQNGANTLGFLRNGSVWVNYGRRCTISGCDTNQVEAELNRLSGGGYQFSLSAGFSANTRPRIDEFFGISFMFLPSVGTYQPSPLQYNYVHLLIGNKEYRNLDSSRCRVEITRFDTVGRVVSGSFEAVLFDIAGGPDSVRITNGRFDAALQLH
jgi:hypothetical protein